MDSSRVPIDSGQLTADPRRIHCHEPHILQYVDFFSTLLGWAASLAAPDVVAVRVAGTLKGVKDRASARVRARVLSSTDSATFKGFVASTTDTERATVYTDGEPAYVGLPNHAAVAHSVGQYVDGQTHTNGMESFWSRFMRGYHGTFHYVTPKHLDRYVGEFEGRHNPRPMDTEDQMRAMVRGMEGKRLTYADLKKPNGLYPGTRP